MRKSAMSTEEAKEFISSIIGVPVRVSVNKGRKRIVRYDGSVSEVYPAVFTLKVDNDRIIKRLSCSYSDVICGDIKILPKASADKKQS